MSKVVEKCYMCNNDAETREHVPPLCLFPPKLPELRTNLITVPSCYEHNSGKSNLDEYFRNTICLTYPLEDNEIVKKHMIPIVFRSIKRNKKIRDFFIKNLVEVDIPTKGGTHIMTGAFPIVKDMWNEFVKHMGYGLFRHHFGKNFNGEIISIENFLYETSNIEFSLLKDRLFWGFERFSPTIVAEGENPKIFDYKMWKINNRNYYLAYIRFYETCVIGLIYKEIV